MRRRLPALVLPLALGTAACGREPVAPGVAPPHAEAPLFQKEGTGLELESVTGLTVPVLGIDLGDVVIQQAVITKFALVENTVGQIVGLEAKGILELTGGVLGTDVVTEHFKTMVSVTPSGPGQCNLVTIDLAPINVNALGKVAFVDVPAAEATVDGSGLVISLLCGLANLLGSGGDLDGLLKEINKLI